MLALSEAKKEVCLYLSEQEGEERLYEKIREIVNPRIPVTIEIVIEKLNKVLRGWVNYFRIGHASKWFKKVKDYVEKKVRRYIRGKRNRAGYGWKGISKEYL